MPGMDQGEMWDQAVEFMRQKGSTPESAKLSTAALKIRRDPIKRHLPREDRRADQIQPVLHSKIRDLVAGRLPWPLFLHGPAGAGKTCAALALLDHLEEPGLYFTASAWADASIGADKGVITWRDMGVEVATDAKVTPAGLQRWVSKASLVVLDEMATRDRVSDWHYEKIKNLLDWRLRLPLIAISNHGLDGITSLYDDRIASRLGAGTVLNIDGDDRRIVKKREVVKLLPGS